MERNASPAEKGSRLVVVFFGPPGVGKGTVATRLAGELGFDFVSSGDLLRDNVARKTELGSRASGFMNAGKLVPDELVTGMVLERLKGLERGVFLDGFPRTSGQAEELSGFLADHGLSLLVIDLEADDGFLEERLSARRICRECGAIYHLRNLPPAKPGRCDKCDGELYRRDDDRPEVIRERLAVYHGQSAPLKSYYRERGFSRTLPGDTPLAETLAAVRKLIVEAG